jgi:ketosteroid isomerase-like protein
VTQEESMAVVQAYYQAYRLDTAAAINSALEDLLAADFSLESPLVQAQRGGPVTGADARAVAAAAAPFLQHASVEVLYATLSGDGVAALIHFPSPVGVVVQSEHFDVDVATGKITRLRSYYDPRKLLPA